MGSTRFTDAAKRREQRARRQASLYAGLSEVLGLVREDTGFSRFANVFSFNNADLGQRRIDGHPGQSAALYVGDTLGEFDIRGAMSARPTRMDRLAGSGGHDITDGTITINVEFTPVGGMTQVVEVPVQVRRGYMLQPGLMYHHGVPFIIAQSSINEVLDAATFGKEPEFDRKHMFSFPVRES